ncbi:FecR family protein [Chitinophaga alhagiae]|uniref:FecR family protein n=1 Tax=Chitinophaga alhagiae TaxID=2203219 RepID=UPI0018E53954|nr:FecR family protein [Chitinophaga alhagiae]
MKNKEQIKELLRRYMDGTTGDAGQQALKEVLADDGMEEVVVAALQELAAETGSDAAAVPGEWHGMHKTITSVDKPFLPRTKRLPLFKTWGWAAAAAVLLAVAGYRWLGTEKGTQPVVAVLPVPDTTAISPGAYGAVLTLADGSTVVLDSLGEGTIAAQAGAVVKLAGGQLAYDAAGAGGEAVWNAMTTARGKQFRLVLPDGSRIWLNAASSIRYPTSFTTGDRVVELQGEAYFEIAGNPQQPFRVILDPETEIQVLGTAFNASNYEGGGGITRTTLVEGAVRIRSFSQSQTLKPGQQALTAPGKIQLISGVDTEQVLAWKNGLFNFNGVGIKEVMQELERWYDIDVKYEGAVTAEKFRGGMQRGLQLSEVLESLKYMGVKCRLEGRTLIVSQ